MSRAVARWAAVLSRLDGDLVGASDPEAPVPGYAPWWPPAVRGDQRAARWRAWWGAR